jgi:hypothetical protein
VTPTATEALEVLTDWERNFLHLHARGGPEAVIVELGAMRDRPRDAEHYGKVGNAREARHVLDAIRAKVEARAVELHAAPNGHGPPDPPRPPERPEPEPEPEPEREPEPPEPTPLPSRLPTTEDLPPAAERHAATEPPPALPEAPEPSTRVDDGVDDFGQARPEPRPSDGWQPREMVECVICERRFWPAGPRHVYCPTHRDPAARPAVEPEAPTCETCDRLLPEDGSACPYCAAQEPQPPDRSPVDATLLLGSLLAEVVALRAELATALQLERDVEQLRAEVERLRGMVDASGASPLDITLGAAVAGLAALGRGEVDREGFAARVAPAAPALEAPAEKDPLALDTLGPMAARTWPG